MREREREERQFEMCHSSSISRLQDVRLIFAFGREEVCEEGGNNHKDKADDDTRAVGDGSISNHR